MRTCLLVILLACGGSSKPAPQPPTAPATTATAPTPPPADPATPPPATPKVAQDPDSCVDLPCVIGAMDSFATKMCGCKDQGCADGVNAELTGWATKLADKPELNNTRPTDDETRQITVIMGRYQDCMTKIMTARDTGLGAGAP